MYKQVVLMNSTRILVVEDEQIVSKDIQLRLKRFGYEIVGAVASGEDAIALAKDTRPDLVMMDVMLKGDMMGTEAAAVIHREYDIPVIYLTAYADQNTLNQAKVTEPYGYVLKPFDERELQTAIEMALYKYRAEKEKQALKEQLLQVQKLEAIGHLTTGVAHNFNNALNVIIGNLELARMHADDTILPYLNRSQKASEGAARIVDGLLAFCRERKMKQDVFDVCGVVCEAADMCRQSLKGEMNLQVHVPDETFFVVGDDNHIQQVILNLCLNARDAVEEIEDARDPQIDVHIQKIERAGVQYVCILVEDNGIGMREDVKQHIFEPFFTTKPVDRGTGLGLATAYGIVNDHHGCIACTSEEGVGTTFSVYLPLTDSHVKDIEVIAPPPSINHIKDAREDARGHTETILVVEDEELVRRTTTELLKIKGYKIIEAVDGRAGWEVFQAQKDEIDLVMLDLSMPWISGLELLKLIIDLAPDTRVIIVTGNPPESILAPGAKAVLAKPLMPNLMFDLVRRVLDDEE
jgi:two-component system cell cycle sensor histidine kinase/response regulator CckA